MATTLKDLCRLCAKKNEFSKDLLDESNKDVLDLIQQFTQIYVQDGDGLPTKVCLDCEEKIVSFQLFILECYKIQDFLKNILLENSQIKLEDELAIFEAPIIKPEAEVKAELTDEVCAINIQNEVSLTDYDSCDFHVDDDDYDELDNVAIASLKSLKETICKKIEVTKEKSLEFRELLKRPNLKVMDFVKFQCSICEETSFKSWTRLSFHYHKSHKSKPFVICMCGFVLRSKSILYKHITEHKQESRKIRKYLEPQTKQYGGGKDFSVKDYINFMCSNCDKKCTSWYNLKSHCERVHKTPPVVRCRCGLTIKSKSVMYKHVQDHNNPNEFSCDQCSLVTKSLASLTKHKMKHVPKEDRKFCCTSCDKIFTNKDALRSHEKSHIPIEERKIFHCEMCNLKFTTRSSLASHKRVVHEKIKSYVCDLCGYACGTNGELRQHRAIHSDDKPYVCKTCSKSFKTYSNLKTHMDTHEATSYACYVCNRVLNSRRTLRKHLLVHEDKCRHVCSYCNKAFKRRQTLKVHMYTHTGDKPLSCKWCEERFAYASTLRSHRLRCHPDKMAAQAHPTYPAYNHVTVQQDYIKNGLAAVGGTKNEAETM